MASLNYSRLLNILCLGFFLMKEMTDACNMTAVNMCTEILSSSTDGNVITEGISAIPTVNQLRKLCGAMERFKACYKPKAAECTRDVVFSMTFGTIENTIEYLCVEGYQDILQYASCWNRTEVIAESTKCHIAQNNMIASLHSQQMTGQLDSSAMRDFWCEILDNTTTCMRNGVVPRCGEAPGCIMHTMMSRALKGLAALMKCTAPTPCTLPSDDTTDQNSDVLMDHSHDGVHTDGSPHTHGDTHHDHKNDGQADPEVNDTGNTGHKTGFSTFSTLVSFVAIYLHIYS